MLTEIIKLHNTFSTTIDPEMRVRKEMLECARQMEKAYAGEKVEPHALVDDGARGRLQACLEPHFFGQMIADRVTYHQSVNLAAIRDTYPAAYASYSGEIEYKLRRRVWEAEKAQRAKHAAFARAGDAPCESS